MKKNFIYLIIILFATFNYGCKKNKPEPGEYIAEFVYIPPFNFNKTESYKIIETTNNYITIKHIDENGITGYSTDTIYKSGKNYVAGKIPSSMQNPYQIDGVWERKKGAYIIKGTFTQTGGSSSYSLLGTFELKSSKK